MVSGEDLGRLVDVNVSLLPVFVNVVFNFVEVDIRRPTVDVNDRQEQVFGWYHHLFEFLLQMLGAPRYV